jgi:cytochrome oxidase assembly protein ShyY1
VRRIQQIAVLSGGFAAAAVMILLGYWQSQVYTTQGAEAAAQRAAQPAVPLESVATAGSAVRDGYGRTVVVSGRYLPDRQLLVPLPGATGAYRVLSALELPDGSVLPVVRGVVRGDLVAVEAPPPPATPMTQTGVLLPSEEAAADVPPTGQLNSVRVPALAQLWPQPLIDGYLALSAPDAEVQGLEPVPLVLPEGQGRLRNGAYAVQWWIFAAFAVLMAAKIARDLGEPSDIDRPIVSAP